MRKPFTKIAAVLLLVIAALQGARAAAGLAVVVDGHSIPVVASWIAATVTLLLAVMLFAESRS